MRIILDKSRHFDEPGAQRAALTANKNGRTLTTQWSVFSANRA